MQKRVCLPRRRPINVLHKDKLDSVPWSLFFSLSGTSDFVGFLVVGVVGVRAGDHVLPALLLSMGLVDFRFQPMVSLHLGWLANFMTPRLSAIRSLRDHREGSCNPFHSASAGPLSSEWFIAPVWS